MSLVQDRSPIEILVGAPGGDLLLVCSDGAVIKAHSQILMLASAVLRNALNTTLKVRDNTITKIPVEGTSASWCNVLYQLYPIHPRPELSYSLIRSMIKISNMYDMSLLQDAILAFLYQRFPAELSPDPSSETYVMSWLALADDLQIEELRDVCMRFVRGLAFNGRLEDTLLERVIPAGAIHNSKSLRRANSLRRISSRSLGADSAGGAAGASVLSDPSSWHQDDRPELHDSVSHLSRGTLEELLASLAMACSMRYKNFSLREAAAGRKGEAAPPLQDAAGVAGLAL